VTAVLRAHGLGKRYRRRWALSDCTLEIPAGRVVGLVEITESTLDGIAARRGGGSIQVLLRAPYTGAYAGAWVLSSHAVDASGHAVDSIRLRRGGACGPPRGGPAQPPAGAAPGAGLSGCFAEIKRLGYRQRVTYQPASRFWPFQWYETAIYAALALGLAGFCFWRLRHRFG
jgi:hypothetical protein